MREESGEQRKEAGEVRTGRDGLRHREMALTALPRFLTPLCRALRWRLSVGYRFATNVQSGAVRRRTVERVLAMNSLRFPVNELRCNAGLFLRASVIGTPGLSFT